MRASCASAKSAVTSSSVSPAPPHAFETVGMYRIDNHLSSDGRWPRHITLHPSLLRSSGVGTVAARVSEASAPLISKSVPPNAAIDATAGGDGSPSMTAVAPLL